jgi:GT2 family glycosyltransferase
MKVNVIMTTFNRPGKTSACLQSISRSFQVADISFEVFIADASTNSLTREAVESSQLGNIELFSVPASVHWAEGMRFAWQRASEKPADYLLWLNDDVVLDIHAIKRLSEVHSKEARSKRLILGGSLRSEVGGATYGGFRSKSRWNPLALRRVGPCADVVECDALNGNIVFVDTATDRMLGGFPTGYKHAMADLDYSFHARSRSVAVLLAPGTMGICDFNREVEACESASKRLKVAMSEKNQPLASWFRLTRRHGGLLWPLIFLSPYVRALRG